MVPKRDSKSLWFDCTPAELTAQLTALTDWGAHFLTLDDLWKGLTGQKPLPEKGVVLTFADNYQGFFDHAWPILKRKGIPVTLFVHTGHVGSQKGRPKMTWDTLSLLHHTGLVSVQSQTVSHPEDISSMPLRKMIGELTDSKAAIESRLKSPCWAIAYPNGKFSDLAAKESAEAGYLIGFTEEQRPAESSPSIMLVPRWVHTKWREAMRSASTD